MTDREYLELAAKAAGYVLGKHTQKDWAFTYGGKEWNPLTDDGDAFRLMVKLRLHAKHFSPYEDDFDIKPPGMVEVWQEDGEDPLHIEYFKPGTDPLAATRRAVVRAAAEIGKGLQPFPTDEEIRKEWT